LVPHCIAAAPDTVQSSPEHTCSSSSSGMHIVIDRLLVRCISSATASTAVHI
jgi:hypothetical protein